VSRTYLNLAATMVLGGLWHGANWTFVLWGAWHGGLLALERLGGRKTAFGLPRVLAVAVTLLFVVIGWVMFRAPDVGTAFGFYAAMAGASGFGLGEAVAWQIPASSVVILVLGILFAVFEVRQGFFARTRTYAPAGPLAQAALVGVFALAVLQLSSTTYSPFLYFQF
jgi:alginate O-acetyltransferase complex protein AlgI